MQCRTYLLNGNNVRQGFCGFLFFAKDHSKNIRRIGEVAKLMVDAGISHSLHSFCHRMLYGDEHQ